MSLKYVLLGLLRQGPKYGYELKREAERLLGGEAELNPGQLYPMLRKLADQQLIVGERVEQEERPDKRVFSLMPAGEQELEAWLNESINLYFGRSVLFLQFVVLMLVHPEERVEYLRSLRRRLVEYIGQLVADRSSQKHKNDLATQALREAAILHAEADLKWIEWLETLETFE